MKIITSLALSIVALLGAAPNGSAADAPLVGEVRGLAISPTNTDAVAQLHRDGWLEAEGQLLEATAFPELFRVVGRNWTSDRVAHGRFAIPQVHDHSQYGTSVDNPYGVLGPGDLVQGGRVLNGWMRRSPISYWIFAGRDASGVETHATVRRKS